VAIKIPFVADVAKFLAGTKDVEKSLDDVADSLDDISTAGADVDRKVGEDLDQLARTADDSADKISKSFKDAFHDVEAAGRTSTRKVKDDVDDVGHKGSATLHEFSQEAKANVAETVSSFDGSASSAVDAIQGTFGGLVSALGPAGLVGAAVVGVGIGLARNLFEKSKEAAAEVAEAVADITGQLIDLGSFSLGTEQVNEKLKEMASTAEDGKNALAEIGKNAAAAGINFRDYARGLAGDSKAIQSSYAEVTAGLDDYWAGMFKLTQQFGIGSPEVMAYADAHRDAFNAITKAQKELLKMDSTLDAAADTTRLYNDATADTTKKVGEADKNVQQMVEHLGLIPKKKSTEVDVDDKGSAKHTKEAVDDAARDRSTTVKVHADMSGVDSQIRSYFNGRVYTFTAQPRPGKAVAT
jgi:methyl-accepting chemotaxis protein